MVRGIGRHLASLLVIAASARFAAAQPYLVKDITATPGGIFDNAPGDGFVELNGRMLFLTHFGLHSSDGTVAGTSLIAPGVAGIGAATANPVNPFSVAVSGRVVFSGLGGYLYVTDGTGPGTSRLLSASGQPVLMRGLSFAVSGASVMFLGSTRSTDPMAVWSTDGTSAGTVGGTAALPADYSVRTADLAAYNGRLYVIALSSTLHTFALFSGDLSGDPITLVQQLGGGSATHRMIAAGSTLYFTIIPPATPTARQVWTLDLAGGQIAPTPLPNQSASATASYTFVQTLPTGVILWQDGGSGGSNGLWLLTPTNATPLTSNDTSQASSLPVGVAINSSVFFNSAAGIRVTNGVASGTRELPLASPAAQLTPLGAGVLFNNAGSGLTGKWFSLGPNDPSPAELLTLPMNATIAWGIIPGVLSGSPRKMFFNAITAASGNEVWVTDQTTANTFPLQDLGHSTLDSTLGWFTPFNGRVLFTSSGPLRITDGTNANTQFLRTVTGSMFFPTKLLPTPTCVLFDNAGQLWRTDGTTAGTFVLGPQPNFPFSGTYPERHKPWALTQSGVVYYAASDQDGLQIWRTDGTVAGTFKITTRAGGFQFPTTSEFAPIGWSSAIFISNGHLWRTDGTPGGTVVVPVTGWPSPSVLEHPLVLGDWAVFSDLQGRLWRSDGTTAGTIPLVPQNAIDTYLASIAGGKIYFFDPGITIPTAWVSDGTPAGTVAIPGITPTDVGRIGSKALFNSAAGVFTSDGTGGPAGLLSATPAVTRSRTFLEGPDETYYFGADGWIWKTDGSVGGTMHASQLFASSGDLLIVPSEVPLNDDPATFDAAFAGSRLLFQATGWSVGRELWGFDVRPSTDCNANGISDSVEIGAGSGWDANHDGVLDDCECLADWNGGGLSVQDLFDFITDWFTGSADFNHSGSTTTQDIFDYLDAWFVGC